MKTTLNTFLSSLLALIILGVAGPALAANQAIIVNGTEYCGEMHIKHGGAAWSTEVDQTFNSGETGTIIPLKKGGELQSVTVWPKPHCHGLHFEQVMTCLLPADKTLATANMQIGLALSSQGYLYCQVARV